MEGNFIAYHLDKKTATLPSIYGLEALNLLVLRNETILRAINLRRL